MSKIAPQLFVELTEVFGVEVALHVYRRLGNRRFNGWRPKCTTALIAELGEPLARKVVQYLVGDGSAPAGTLEFRFLGEICG